MPTTVCPLALLAASVELAVQFLQVVPLLRVRLTKVRRLGASMFFCESYRALPVSISAKSSAPPGSDAMLSFFPILFQSR
jgi:hypothetical protein